MSAQIPAEFQPMPDEGIAAKYPAPRRPLAAWTSASGQVDFVVTEKTTPFQPGDERVLLGIYKANLLNLYSGGVEFTRQEVANINGHDFAAFEFMSTLTADKGTNSRQGPLRRYGYLLYTVLPPVSAKDRPRLVTFAFACPAVLAADWQPLARRTMASVKVR